MQINRYFEATKEIINQVQETQYGAMEQVAQLFTRTVENGNTIFVTGCSHSNIFAQEVFYRAGGFMLMNPIFLPGMNLQDLPPTRTSKLERISGTAEAVLSELPIKAGDVLVIASIAGRNAVPVELGLWAKEHGIHVVALTSMNYSGNVTSRHSSGKLLYQIADYVLDVMCEKGDAVLEIEGLPVKTAPTSTVTGIMIMHAVISQTIENLIQKGITPPVFLSGNLDGGDAHNKRLLEENKHRIFYTK